MRTLRLAGAIASALALSTPASAGFFDFTLAPYLGVNAGLADYEGACDGSISCDDSDFAYKIFGGLEVNEYISMEAGFADLGKADARGTSTGKFEANGVTLQLLGTYAVNPSISLLARGGFNILDVDATGSFTPSTVTSDTDIAWSLGAGVQYNFTRSIGLRVEWERFFEAGAKDTIGTADIDLFSAGLVYTFR